MRQEIARNGATQSKTSTAAEVGRNLLADWEAAQPDNFFTDDVNFQRLLEFYWGREGYSRHAKRLYNFGRLAATEMDMAVRTASRDENLPVLERFDGIGRRRETVAFHPAHHVAGRIAYGSGMMTVYESPGNNLLSLALFYLSSQNGEAGHNCPIACTAGLIKVLQAVAHPALQERYLPTLLDSDYDTNGTGAQFLTEVQGGSDVGANAMRAQPMGEEPQRWLLTGEKWFCSNVTADLALVTARVPDQGRGTRGLGLFLVPRYLEDGQLNNIRIRRLKDKLGTRSMATGELDFDGAVAYQVGPTELGFKHVMTYVINTSRIYNAVGVCGNARRAATTAHTYAKYRTAFGQPIIHFPLVQDQIARLRVNSAAILAGTFQLVKLLDDIELHGSNSEADAFLRMAINLNKYRSAVIAHEVIVQAIELLGGNGAIETFSVLPRLLRDNVVYENWEGTHNVLLAQVQRDIRRYAIHGPFFKALERLYEATSDDQLRDEGLTRVAAFQAELDEVLGMDELTAAIYLRPLMDKVTDLYYAGCLASEGAWEYEEKDDRTKLRMANLFFSRRVLGRGPKDIPYYDDQVSRLAS
ncbi:MAG: acyl-CoA dehydrogenase family protein [Candidatus Promineifilaceae bacterium]|nr:acyl-CoA dehydrogenase family protein [Candidatus Promineifilaceae bacterium]